MLATYTAATDAIRPTDNSKKWCDGCGSVSLRLHSFFVRCFHISSFTNCCTVELHRRFQNQLLVSPYSQPVKDAFRFVTFLFFKNDILTIFITNVFCHNLVVGMTVFCPYFFRGSVLQPGISSLILSSFFCLDDVTPLSLCICGRLFWISLQVLRLSLGSSVFGVSAVLGDLVQALRFQELQLSWSLRFLRPSVPACFSLSLEPQLFQSFWLLGSCFRSFCLRARLFRFLMLS